MPIKILLITPPFTQINTPYPATPYLTGFLKSRGYDVFQADLGIELINAVLSREGYQELFDSIRKSAKKLSPNSRQILKNKEKYIETIDPVMDFLQYRDHTLAQLICSETFLPRAARFAQLPDLEWSFGNIGINDKARFLATLYIEDVGDLIKDAVTPYFGFSRYAEKLGLSAQSFAPIAKALQQPENILESHLLSILKDLIEQVRPHVVGITLPFPGNLYAGLKCGQYLKKHYPHIKIVAGGGFVNTELRSLSEPAIFDYVDFITLDDGERPLLSIVESLQNKICHCERREAIREISTQPECLPARSFPTPGGRGSRGEGSLRSHPPPAPPVKGGEMAASCGRNVDDLPHAPLLTRTYIRRNNEVLYINQHPGPDFSHAETGCPDYCGLHLDKYLSLIEMANPMHRLWSDGCWNKLTIARGCYWHKCAFCDTSLPYIKHFDSAPSLVLVDRIEQIIAQTGHRGFHFVDEAAPPAILKDVAKELLKRKIRISWWTNIRFENAFTEDLCRLLSESGCIAVTGGLESASDRLLKLMNKGVNIRQAAQVCDHFSKAGVMVHAYLIYGFPTQTLQETIDALEIVRQFFEEGLIQSAFWHRFSATVHSDVGNHSLKYSCTIKERPSGGFARNDLAHIDHAGCDHHLCASGLNKATYNFMHGIGTDIRVQDWFDFPAPSISIKRNFVKQAIQSLKV